MSYGYRSKWTYEEEEEPEVLLTLNIGPVETEDLFEPEIIETPKPTTTYEERLVILNELKLLDIQIGCVVTKRKNYPTTRIMPMYWGIVSNLVNFLHDNVNYKPYCVRWLDGTYGYFDYKELIVITYAPEERELDFIKLEPSIEDV